MKATRDIDKAVPSVRPWHSSIISRCLDMSSKFFHCQITQSF